MVYISTLPDWTNYAFCCCFIWRGEDNRWTKKSSPTLIPDLSSSSIVLETTLEEDSGLDMLWRSLGSLPTGVKGDPEVPKTGKYPVWAEWSAGEEWSNEFWGERKGELLSSALLLSSWIWLCNCCNCCKWADWRAGWSKAGLAAPEIQKPWITWNQNITIVKGFYSWSSKQDD